LNIARGENFLVNNTIYFQVNKIIFDKSFKGLINAKYSVITGTINDFACFLF
jgi:hypothetical protein